jgi:very-short-patch-repair endonuclease
VAEFEFSAKRKWRFDFAWPEQKVALEIQGGVHSSGRHTSGTGYHKDMEKLNRAQLAGWIVLLVTPKYAVSLGTTAMLQEAFALHK